MQSFRRTLASALLGVLFVIAVSGQEPEPKEIVPPDDAMQQLMLRVIGWYFKPTKSIKTVRLSEGISPRWLPKIRNVYFEYVPDHEIYKYQGGVLIMESIEFERGVYSVNVGWGDRECHATGEVWRFRPTGGVVRVWPTSLGWGRGCGGNMPPQVRGLKIGTISPNELPGYEFFSNGKLKDIRLAVSTGEDMKKIFGDTCEGFCDYDENWTVWVNYLKEEGGSETSTDENGIETKTVLKTKAEYIGKLRFVTLRPKHRISFANVRFSGAFAESDSYSMACGPGNDGVWSSVHTNILNYTDGFGLEYSLFVKKHFIPQDRKYTEPADEKMRKRDLLSIEYQIPKILEQEIYTKEIVP